MKELLKNSLLICIFLFIPAYSYAANTNLFNPNDTIGAYLQIINRTTNKTVTVKEGNIISIWIEGQKFRGEVTKISYDKIYINHAGFKISDIYHIKVSRTFYKVAGVFLKIYGGLYFVTGFILYANATIMLGDAIVSGIFGGAFYLWGHSVYNGKNYKLKNWKYISSENDCKIEFIDD